MTAAPTSGPWLPRSACTPRCTADPAPAADPALRRHRWRRLTGALAGAGVAALRVPLTGARGRRRLVVCAAARLLTAAGVRVEVHASPVAWPVAGPRSGPLVVANSVSWLDALALRTVVPGVPVVPREQAGRLVRRSGVVTVDRSRLRELPGTVAQVTALLAGGTAVTVQPEGATSCGAELGRFRPAFFQAAVDAAAPVCPVAVRYRVDGGAASAVAASLAGEPPFRSLARVVATRGLVVEVHLLPALDPAGADRRELAALAEYAIAQVTEARPPVVTAHPRRPRVPAPVRVRRPGAARAA
ncbi:lysophospholipid acyltransferase family protein [Modestobacter versicolor]|uniref:lysophospholipid acyltransferase family protein n=1 Tax=Modestobacter versicolor TaxID=429133 RepID=UPI0034DE7889